MRGLRRARIDDGEAGESASRVASAALALSHHRVAAAAAGGIINVSRA